MRGSRLLPLALLVLLSTLPGPLSAEELAEAQTLRALDRVAKDLASVGRGEETETVIDVLRRLGHDSRALARLRTTCRKALNRGRLNASREKTVRKKLTQVVAALAEKLAALGPEGRNSLAREILRLDGGNAAARGALGHVEAEGRWMTAEQARLLPRRRGFQDVLRKARRYPLDIVRGGAADPAIEAATGQPGTRVSWGSVEVHGALPLARLERILREAIRASIVANWLLTGEAAVPPLPPIRWLLVRTKAQYLRCLDEELRLGRISRDERAFANEFNFYQFKTGGVRRCPMRMVTEAFAESSIALTYLDFVPWPPLRRLDDGQPGLKSGLVHLVCLAYLGYGKPSYATRVRVDGTGGRSTAKVTPPRLVALYPRAGLAGNRRYIAWLVRAELDPPWIRTFREHEQEIGGDELIKAASVLEFLAEHGPLLPLFAATTPARAKGDTLAPAIERALGEPLDRLEERWRDWVVPGRSPGLLERMGGGASSGAGGSPEDAKALAYLNAVRTRAGVDGVEADDGLAADAKRHADYLAENPEQLSAWPDAHEEYPDRPGFSPEGCWAGLHSVIAPGCDSVPKAVDCWLGTFYHRLPLLDPGLLAVGWGSTRGTVVLDAGSIVISPWYEKAVLWPPDKAKDVPTQFQPEIPNPVPGEDQSSWGYPVTLQVWGKDGDAVGTVTMSLHPKRRAARAVPAHFSTPGRPTNPDLAPRNAYCLIPKQPLRPGTRYVVAAEIDGPTKVIVWEFTTGR
jgi:cysteine-rich secretory family protein